MRKRNILSIGLIPFVFLLFYLFLASPALAQTCTDADEDGYGLSGDASCPNAGVDCDDDDPNVYPGAVRICDAKDSDCDGFEDFFTDKDQDGDGSTLCTHWLTGLKDCDDNNPVMYPGNVEGPFGDPTCSDGFDNDCDFRKDASDSGCRITCQDSDGDGYGDPGDASCPNGAAIDCNDTNISINPGALDTNCNNVDENCSGTADDSYVPTATNCGTGECASTGTRSCSGGVETDSCVAGLPATEGAFGHPTCSDTLDNDCDGATDESDIGCQGTCLDDDGDGYGFYGDASCTNPGVDCNDDNAAINPGAVDDVCDGVDANCSGTADDQYTPTVTNCGVGECATTGLLVCTAGAPVDNCSPPAPGTEGPFGDLTCSDTLDNDCDGMIDNADIDCNPLDEDNDGDGFCEIGPCQNPSNLGGDCDDTDAVTYPGAPRICDAKDNDCDGFQDFFTDVDGDGDGVPMCGGDCDDNDATRYPGNVEGPFGDPSCEDNIDNDCDYKIDSMDSQCQLFCPDIDGDGYGNPGSGDCPNGGATDCNDTDTGIYPGAADDECDGVDNNCSGTADDGYVPTATNCGTGECAATGTLTCSGGVETDSCTAGVPAKEGALGHPTCSDTFDNDCDGATDASDTGCLTPCLDDDGDGYGYYSDASCTNPEVDCNDDNGAINPGVTDDVCDGVDANCSGTADDEYVATITNCGVGSCAATGLLVCTAGATTDNCSPLAAGTEGPFGDPNCSDALDNDCDGVTDSNDTDCNPLDEDNDGDGFCESSSCSDGSLPGDCNDLDPVSYPGAERICDGKDNDCDGFQDFFTDIDNDGDGVPLCGGDCDDSDPDRYPGNKEGPLGDATCSDLIDNDCDSKIDDADADCAPPTCGTKIGQKDGPHIFNLLDGGNNVLKTPCLWCHFDDSGTVDERTKCERCHADPAWGGVDDGTLKVLYPLDPPYGFGTALNVRMHSSTVVGTKYGSWDMDCLTCHNPHIQEQDARYGTSYGKYIKEYICFDNPVTGLNVEEIIEFTAAEGAGSFTDGPPNNENICEMCHTQTNYHQRTGLSPAHNDGTDCADCHLHEEGFKPSCGTCHAVPPPTGTHLTHFGATKDDAVYGSTSITEDYSGLTNIYVINCGNCHPLDALQHINGVPNSGNGTAEIELYNPDAPAGSLKSLNPPTATYTPGSQVFTDADGFDYTQGRCDNVYCHSVTDFATTGPIPEPFPWVYPLQYDPPWEDFVVKDTQYQSPVWGVDSLGCDGCHGHPITTECRPNPITGACTEVDAGAGDSHAWFDMYGELNLHAWNMKIYFDPLQCNTCHFNTVREDAIWFRDEYSVYFDDIQIYNTAMHVNGVKDIAFTEIPVEYQRQFTLVLHDLSTAVFDPVDKTCSNVSCHESQTLVKWGAPYRWDNETECNVCHSY